MREATACPVCGWQTEVWVDAAPGGGSKVCKVCDLRAENDLLRRRLEELYVENQQLRQ